jgi:transposase
VKSPSLPLRRRPVSIPRRSCHSKLARVRTHQLFFLNNTILIRIGGSIGEPKSVLASDNQWARIEPHLPKDVCDVERARRPTRDQPDRSRAQVRLPLVRCPEADGPPTTIYNRFLPWARRGIWENLFRELAGNGRSTDTQMIDSARQSAPLGIGRKRGSRSRPLAARAEGATRRSTHSQC